MNPQDALSRDFPPGTRVLICHRYHGVVTDPPMRSEGRSRPWMVRVRCDDGIHRYGTLHTLIHEPNA